MSGLDQPIRVGPRVSRNRLVQLAVNTGFARDHRMTPRFTAYLAARAPRLGAIVSGLTPVHPSSVYKTSVLKNTGDEDLPALAGFAEAIGGGGALSILQLVHNGGQMPATAGGPLRLTPSGQAAIGFTGACAAMGPDDLAEIIRAFADAADRARRAGLDGVEVHGAHGFLLHQFLSPLTNHRTDHYGGSVQARLRFPRDVLDAVRQRVGSAVVVGFRLAADEFTPGGIDAEAAQVTAATLADAGLVDYVSVTAGNYASLEHGISPLTMPDLPLAELCRGIRAVVAVPVIAANRVRTAAQAEALVADGTADLVGVGRALLADADFGRASARPCIGTNACFAGGGVTTADAIECAVNPRLAAGRETPPPVTRRSAGVLVVGAGVAGLAFALEAVRAGLSVRIAEAASGAGGLIPGYDHALTEGRFGAYVSWALGELAAHGVEPTYRTAVSPQTLPPLLGPEPIAVVLATGSRVRPGAPADARVVADGLSLLTVPPPPGRIAVVAEDDAPVGLQLARYLARAGHPTRLVVAGSDPAPGMESLTRRTHLSDLRAAGGEVRLDSGPLDGGSVHSGPLTGPAFDDVDVVAWCARRVPVVPAGLADAAAALGLGTYRVGDCAAPASIVDATRAALRLADDLIAKGALA